MCALFASINLVTCHFSLTKVSGAVDLLRRVGGLEGIDLTQRGVDARDDGEGGHVDSKTNSKKKKRASNNKLLSSLCALQTMAWFGNYLPNAVVHLRNKSQISHGDRITKRVGACSLLEHRLHS